MSKINNEPKIKNPLVTAVRGQLEQELLGYIYFAMKPRRKELILWRLVQQLFNVAVLYKEKT